ncbi:MAG TPA: ABC transporter permease [Vicinamibacteria bacterium]|nr:ABC transporter permease [Vicinamibacteria bacterium]
MKRVLRIARREYLERVRSKAFLVGTVLGPLLLFGAMLGPSLLMSKQRGKPLKVAVLDHTGELREPVSRELEARRAEGRPRFEVADAEEGTGAADVLRDRVRRGELDGFVEVKQAESSDVTADYYGRNLSNIMDIPLLEQAVAEAVIGHRLAGAGLPKDRVRALTRRPEFKTIQVTAQGAREDKRGGFLASMLMLTLLYTALAMWGAAIMNGVLEEKTNRVVEVVVSSVSPVHLFAGKLLGVGATGLTQFLVWGATMAVIGLYGSTMTGVPVPPMDPGVLVAFPLFFLLGYFFYGALFAGLGATFNSQQDAQSLTFLVMLPLIVGFAMFPVVLNNPEGPLAIGLSLVPFFTPLLMFLRISAVTPPLWQIALAVVVQLLSIALAVVAAARIYRVGILMHGKRPTFPELAKWVRQA